MKALAWSCWCVLLTLWFLFISITAGSSISDSKTAKLQVIELRREIVRLRNQLDYQNSKHLMLFQKLGVDKSTLDQLKYEFEGKGLQYDPYEKDLFRESR